MTLQDWNAKCSYVNREGLPCKHTNSVYENGQPRCSFHTAAKLALSKPSKAEEKKRIKAENAERRARESAEHADQYWANLSAPRKTKPAPLPPISQRKRPWSMCRLCRRSTDSGKPERDEAQRYCRFHMPLRNALFQAEVRQALIANAVCTVNGSRFRGCRVPLINTKKRLSRCMAKPRCQVTATVCFDVGSQWKVSRARCRVRFPKHGIVEAVKPLAPRTERGAPAPSTTPG